MKCDQEILHFEKKIKIKKIFRDHRGNPASYISELFFFFWGYLGAGLTFLKQPSSPYFGSHELLLIVRLRYTKEESRFPNSLHLVKFGVNGVVGILGHLGLFIGR